MTKDPVADFWGNIECALGESSFRYIIEDLIVKVRKQLDDSSITAQAINISDNYKEIAEVTGLNLSQVKVYIFRGRQKLKNYIGKMDVVI